MFKTLNHSGDVRYNVPKHAEKQPILGVKKYSVLVFDGGLCDEKITLDELPAKFKVTMFSHNEKIVKIYFLSVRAIGEKGYADFTLSFLAEGITKIEIDAGGKRFAWNVHVILRAGADERAAVGESKLQYIESSYQKKSFILSCFPGDAQVYLDNHEVVAMHTLKVGQHVLDNGHKSSSVFMFSHRDPHVVASFVRVKYWNAHDNVTNTLTASHGHYVWTNLGLRTMIELEVGDSLLDAHGTLLGITAIAQVTSKGLYNPHTLSGTLVVDGILVSSYTRAIQPQTAHSTLSFVRALYRLMPNTSLPRIASMIMDNIHLLRTMPVLADNAYFRVTY